MSGEVARAGGFARGLKQIAGGKILSPVLTAELMKPRFRSFSVPVKPWTERPPDGWFHPSTHGDWPARKLALYLRHPEELEVEEITLEKVMAVTQGHFWHEFCGRVFLKNGIVSKLELPCTDEVHNRRGHMDGKLANGEGLEMKTINNEWLVKKITDLASLKEFKPGYFAQAQDYLDMHDLEKMRFFMIAMFYPYPMMEFIVPRDETFIRAQRAKYREAMEMATEDRELPEACCLPRSTEAKTGCELRTACPVGKATLKLVSR